MWYNALHCCHCYMSWKIIMLPYYSNFHVSLFLSLRALNGTWRESLLTRGQNFTVWSKTMRRWDETGTTVASIFHGHADNTICLCSTTTWLWVWLWTHLLKLILPKNRVPLLFSILIHHSFTELKLGEMTILHTWLVIYGKTDIKGYSWIIPLHQNVKNTGGP